MTNYYGTTTSSMTEYDILRKTTTDY